MSENMINERLPFSDYPDVISVKDLMQMLNIGKTLAYKILVNGTIKSKKVGREYIIAKKAVIKFLEDIS